MITVESNFHDSQCNTCNGRDDVKAVRFRAPGSNGSVIVALCKACRAEGSVALAAMPPDHAPTGERRPCAAWRDYGATSRLVIPHGPTMRVYRLAADLTWRWYLDGGREEPKDDPAHATKEEAQLAAEDHAAELLREGMRKLGAK